MWITNWTGNVQIIISEKTGELSLIGNQTTSSQPLIGAGVARRLWLNGGDILT